MQESAFFVGKFRKRILCGLRRGSAAARRRCEGGFFLELAQNRFLRDVKAGGQRFYPFALKYLVALLYHGVQKGLDKLRLVLRRRGAGAAAQQGRDPEFQGIGRLCEFSVKSLAPVFVQVFIGVQTFPQISDLNIHACVHKNIGSPDRGGYARVVSVKHQYRVFGVSLDESRVVRGQGCAQRRHRERHAVLVCGYHVHVPFHDQKAALFSDLGQRFVDAVKSAPF